MDVIYMLCQFCGEREATCHTIIALNGQSSELYLCGQCALSKGIGGGFGFGGNVLGSLISPSVFKAGMFYSPGMKVSSPSATLKCPACGTSFDETAADGYVGCAECYRTFKPRLAPLIRGIHGQAAHNGKQPQSGAKQNERDSLKRQLDECETRQKQAVSEQNFEEAAVLRDKIKDLREKIERLKG